jgi:hypothetical protein
MGIHILLFIINEGTRVQYELEYREIPGRLPGHEKQGVGNTDPLIDANSDSIRKSETRAAAVRLATAVVHGTKFSSTRSLSRDLDCLFAGILK